MVEWCSDKDYYTPAGWFRLMQLLYTYNPPLETVLVSTPDFFDRQTKGGLMLSLISRAARLFSDLVAAGWDAEPPARALEDYKVVLASL